MYFFFWPLRYLFFFDLPILITPLVSSTTSNTSRFINRTSVKFGVIYIASVTSSIIRNNNITRKHGPFQILEALQNVVSDDGFRLEIQLLSPKSQGHVRLASRNPFVHPLIDPKYLENIEDVYTLIRGKLKDKIKKFDKH